MLSVVLDILFSCWPRPEGWCLDFVKKQNVPFNNLRAWRQARVDQSIPTPPAPRPDSMTSWRPSSLTVHGFYFLHLPPFLTHPSFSLSYCSCLPWFFSLFSHLAVFPFSLVLLPPSLFPTVYHHIAFLTEWVHNVGREPGGGGEIQLKASVQPCTAWFSG